MSPSPAVHVRGLLCLGALTLGMVSCKEDGTVDTAVTERGDMPGVEPPEPALLRISETQYLNALADLFGEEIA
ncbi:MAG: hypothetical protein QGG40_01190, partial [Myxococcota bacterium]|nr:hypothetical protein [Myxococcota bacterium]